MTLQLLWPLCACVGKLNLSRNYCEICGLDVDVQCLKTWMSKEKPFDQERKHLSCILATCASDFDTFNIHNQHNLFLTWFSIIAASDYLHTLLPQAVLSSYAIKPFEEHSHTLEPWYVLCLLCKC